jgi:hypothetical protein
MREAVHDFRSSLEAAFGNPTEPSDQPDRDAASG